MTSFFSKQRLVAIASIALSLSLVGGCRSAGYRSESSSGESGYGTAPFYQSYPKPIAPYSEDINQPPSSQPNSSGVAPVPGYSDPEVPPAPSAQRSKRGFTPSNLKNTFNRTSSDVQEMASKTGERLSAFGRNLVNRKIQRDQYDAASDDSIQPPDLSPNAQPITEISGQEASQDSSAVNYPKAYRSRTRSSTLNRSQPLRGMNQENNDDVPKLTPPVTTNSSNSTTETPPRLLSPQN